GEVGSGGGSGNAIVQRQKFIAKVNNLVDSQAAAEVVEDVVVREPFDGLNQGAGRIEHLENLPGGSFPIELDQPFAVGHGIVNRYAVCIGKRRPATICVNVHQRAIGIDHLGAVVRQDIAAG